MAEAVEPNTELLLEWPKKDKRRILHFVYRVGDLDRNIKFYTEALGMKLLRRKDFPEDRYSFAVVGFGPEESQCVVKLTYNYGVTSYDVGNDFGHFGIATPDVGKLVEKIKAEGGNIVLEATSVEVQGTKYVIGFVKDSDGCTFELIQRDPTPQPLCQAMLTVSDLHRSINFYHKVLGMRLLRKIDSPQKYTIAVMGYEDEEKTTILELTYKYGDPVYTKGNAYAQVVICSDDVSKSVEVAKLVVKEVGGSVIQQSEINTKIASILDPDGWKIVLVDNQHFLQESNSETLIA